MYRANSLCYKRTQRTIMSSSLMKLLLILIFLVAILQKSDGEEVKEWCIADEQFSDKALHQSLDWACGNGADCSKIEFDGPCYLPNTMKDHASYAFNSYYQNFKTKGGSCWFTGAGMVTEFDPSHDECKFEFIPMSKNNGTKQ